MTTRPYVLDPELEGLLREAAKDPGSALFRKLPREPLQRLALGTGALRASATELSRLDRHLVEAWRHELAGLLFDAALEQFASGPGGARMVMYRSPTEPLVLDSPETIRANVESTLERGGPTGVEPRAWLDDWLSGRRAPTVSGLVILSHRIVPNSRVVVLGALASLRAEDVRSAEAALHTLLQFHRDPGTRERAHEALGAVHGKKGDLPRAITQLMIAHELEPERGHAVLSWFTCALEAEDEGQLAAASTPLEESVPIGSKLLAESISKLKALLERGELKMSDRATAIAVRRGPKMGPVASALCEVFVR